MVAPLENFICWLWNWFGEIIMAKSDKYTSCSVFPNTSGGLGMGVQCFSQIDQVGGRWGHVPAGNQWTILQMFFHFSKSFWKIYMSHFSYACKTERQNGISCLISELLHTLNSSLRDRLFHVTEWTFPNSLIIQTCQYFVLSCLNRHVFLQ